MAQTPSLQAVLNLGLQVETGKTLHTVFCDAFI